MTNDLSVLDAANPLRRPFQVTKTRLGTITKLFDERYICNNSAITELFQAVAGKLKTLQPSACIFSYLLSFNDNTHIEGTSPDDFGAVRLATPKRVDRLVLKWTVSHQIDGLDNEMAIMVRVSNPVNPVIVLQAAMSKQPDEFDNIEFGNGCTSVSVCGASPLCGDEIIQIVGTWMKARPRPEFITGVHEMFEARGGLFRWLNYWLLPLLGVVAAGLWMSNNPDSKYVIHVGVFAVLAHWYLCKISQAINERAHRYIYNIKTYSVFDLTNGDLNQMTKYAAKSRNSMIKLIANGAYSVLGNIIAAYLCYRFFGWS